MTALAESKSVTKVFSLLGTIFVLKSFIKNVKAIRLCLTFYNLQKQCAVTAVLLFLRDPSQHLQIYKKVAGHQTKPTKGPSIKDVGIFFRFFDNPLPHVVMHVFNFIHQQISSCFDPYPPLSL